MNGSVLANRDLKRQLLDEDEHQRLAVEQDHDLYHTYLRQRAEAIENAQRKGKPMKEFWIEPEDITFNSGQFVKVRGPLCEDDLVHFEFFEKLLKLIIFEVTYDCCHFASEGKPLRDAVKVIASLQHFVTSAVERISNAYWTYLEVNFICHTWRLANSEREKVWTEIGWPVPQRR